MRRGCLLLALAIACHAQTTTIALKDALTRARQYSGQLEAAVLAAKSAHQDRVQARAARLPSLSGLNQFIYTEGNKTPSGVFVANDGVHVYNEQLNAHEELLALLRKGEVHAAAAAEAAAIAKQSIAERGLQVTVVQNYYAVAVAQRKLQTAQQSLKQASEFVDMTQKQEQAGESAHADVIKAQLQSQQKLRDLEDAQLAIAKAKLALSILIFPTATIDFEIQDDLNAAPETAVTRTKSPEIKAAEANLTAAKSGVSVAEYAYLPSLSLDVWYGIDANQFAARTDYPTQATGRSTLPNFQVPYRQNLGYVAQATLTIPIWNWGAIRSKVIQARLKERQAELDLQTANKQVAADLMNAQQELATAQRQVASLHDSTQLAHESLRLTLLRYQAGEATALEVVDAQTTDAQAENAEADGLLRYRIAAATLRALQGTL